MPTVPSRAQGWVQGCRSGGWGGAGPLPGSGAADLSIGDWEQRSRMSHPNGRLSQVPHPCPIHGGLFGINPVAGAPMIGVTASQGGAQHAHPAQDLIHGAGVPQAVILASQAKISQMEQDVLGQP